MKKLWNKIKTYTMENGMNWDVISTGGIGLALAAVAAAVATGGLAVAGVGLIPLLVSTSLPAGFLAGTAALVGLVGITFACVGLGCSTIAGIDFLFQTATASLPKTETNEAGQSVKGPRWALRCLHLAQRDVEGILGKFNSAAAVTAEARQEIQERLAYTVKAQQAVTILAAGTQGAPVDKYAFVTDPQEDPVVEIKQVHKPKTAAL